MYDKRSNFALSGSFLFCLIMEIEHCSVQFIQIYFPRLTNRLIAAIKPKCKFVVRNFKCFRTHFLGIRAEAELRVNVRFRFWLRDRIEI